ncbi:MAG: hypothetical protein F4039_00010 [Gammaproteobacteria bacterium]|nr:hypothetical protein [Gammaproteobacteria bacterium]MYF53127.1 hypothetical protein [Gammaproteobacteria bacterium]MYK42465.1 hypothetical protein [Gammaproteobacteria bacterium]
MAISLQDVVDDLYRIAVLEGSTQSPSRLDLLADLCIEQLSYRKVNNVGKEIVIPGFGRSKKWDVAWPSTGKTRLGISLKSLLSNIRGTVPNRIDDLMGELTSVQLKSPEIVTGYIVIFDAASNGNSYRRDGTRWIDFFSKSIEQLTGRDSPSWASGTLEASAIVTVDFTSDARVLDAPDLNDFFDRITDRLRDRNPELFE